jgi:hypothetical protein
MHKQIVKELERTFNETTDSIVNGVNKIQRLIIALKNEGNK